MTFPWERAQPLTEIREANINLLPLYKSQNRVCTDEPEVSSMRLLIMQDDTVDISHQLGSRPKYQTRVDMTACEQVLCPHPFFALRSIIRQVKPSTIVLVHQRLWWRRKH